MVSMETPAVTPFTNQAHRNHANPGVTHSVTPRILSKVDGLYFSVALHSRPTLKDKTNLTSARFFFPISYNFGNVLIACVSVP